jgi:hypothetical protein
MVRDPRKDPKPGDWTVTRKGEHALFEDWFWLVLARSTDGKQVTYMDDDGNIDTTDIAGWQQGSKDDEVLHVAE